MATPNSNHKKKKLYVGNISFDAQEQDIVNFFAPHKIIDVRIITHRDTGQPRGFAFVQLEDNADLDKVVGELNQQEMLGRRIVVNEANEKPRQDNQRRDDRR